MRGAARGIVPAALLCLAVALAAVAGTATAADDPALEALRSRDAYVSPRVLGAAAAAEEQILAQSAAALREAGRPVKLAVVLGPAGAPSLQAYARRLAVRLGHEGTVLVTRPGGAVAAATATSGADLAARLRAAGVDAVPNPVERLVRASRVAAVPVAPDEDADDWGGLALVGVAIAGGAWAAAIGLGRAGRLDRRRLSESRALARVHLDALRARALVLARSPGLPPEGRRRVEGALGTYAEVVAALQEAPSPEAVEEMVPRIDAALAGLAGVAAALGDPFPPDRPFDGLCAADPAHGPATEEGPVTDIDGPARVCTACREAADGGRPPHRRLLPRDGRPVPFDEPVGAGRGAPSPGPAG